MSIASPDEHERRIRVAQRVSSLADQLQTAADELTALVHELRTQDEREV